MTKTTQKLKRLPNTRLQWRETEDGLWFAYRHCGYYLLYRRELENGEYTGDDRCHDGWQTVAQMNAYIATFEA